MADVREHAFTIKGFLTAHGAPPDMLAGIEMIIAALPQEQVTINARIPVDVSNLAEITRRFIEGRKGPTSSFPSSNDAAKQEVKTYGPGEKINTTLKAIENIRKNSPNVPEREDLPEKAPKTDEIIPSGNISPLPTTHEEGDFGKPGTAEPKPSKASEWTPERKAAQAAIMRARHAARKAGQKGGRQARTPEESTRTDDEAPEEEPAPVPFANVKKVDMLGEPLIDVGPVWESAYRKPIHDEYVGVREDGVLQPGDLVDIHDMLGHGKSTAEIAVHYGCTKKQLEAFILKHPNVQITKCDPKRFTGDTVTRPSVKGSGARY